MRADHTEQGVERLVQPLPRVAGPDQGRPYRLAVGHGKVAQQAAPPAATAPSKSSPVPTPSRASAHCPPTCATPLTTFTDVQVRTNVSQVGNTSTMNCRLRSDVSAGLPKK
jgi:hypothetical protein